LFDTRTADVTIKVDNVEMSFTLPLAVVRNPLMLSEFLSEYVEKLAIEEEE